MPLVKMRPASYRPSGAGLSTRARQRACCHVVHAFVVGFPDHVNGESMMVAGCPTGILPTGNLAAALTRIVLTTMACSSAMIEGVCPSSASAILCCKSRTAYLSHHEVVGMRLSCCGAACTQEHAVFLVWLHISAASILCTNGVHALKVFPIW